MITRRFLISALAVVLCAAPASATISYYSTLSSFNAADVSAQSLSFDSITLNNPFPTATVSGFVFSSTSSYNFGELIALTNPGGTWPTTPTTNVLSQYPSGGNSDGSIVILLPANVFGVGFYTSYALAQDDMNAQVTTVSPDAVQKILNPGPTAPQFFGVRSTVDAITQITLAKTFVGQPNNGYSIQLGDFFFDTVPGSDTGVTLGDAPEPRSLLLIGLGLLILPLLRRRTS